MENEIKKRENDISNFTSTQFYDVLRVYNRNHPTETQTADYFATNYKNNYTLAYNTIKSDNIYHELKKDYNYTEEQLAKFNSVEANDKNKSNYCDNIINVYSRVKRELEELKDDHSIAKVLKCVN